MKWVALLLITVTALLSAEKLVFASDVHCASEQAISFVQQQEATAFASVDTSPKDTHHPVHDCHMGHCSFMIATPFITTQHFDPKETALNFVPTTYSGPEVLNFLRPPSSTV